MHSTIKRAIECIWKRYEEPLTIADLARSAILSKYHFCRTFARATGVTPGRFLSAVRIYQAKRLLSSTSLNVTDISFAVGFNSLGSFTNRFTESVGISPGRFRRRIQEGALDIGGRPGSPASPGRTIDGMVLLPKGYAIASLYVGVFQTAIFQGQPLAAATLKIRSSGQWGIPSLHVPHGEWFTHAVAVADTIDPEPWSQRVLLVAKTRLPTVKNRAASRFSLSLRPASLTDPPLLFALPALDNGLDAVSVTAGHHDQADTFSFVPGFRGTQLR